MEIIILCTKSLKEHSFQVFKAFELIKVIEEGDQVDVDFEFGKYNPSGGGMQIGKRKVCLGNNN